jgi:myo-inositol-1-phosphate synthase
MNYKDYVKMSGHIARLSNNKWTKKIVKWKLMESKKIEIDYQQVGSRTSGA